ncbi:hypothetical protein DFS34DRAFT_297103 [Phlyctochytrium arcticum]|nr:hypothetical protein DFS34DRAFT_297103 [Phlyctochytrium arcticum]
MASTSRISHSEEIYSHPSEETDGSLINFSSYSRIYELRVMTEKLSGIDLQTNAALANPYILGNIKPLGRAYLGTKLKPFEEVTAQSIANHNGPLNINDITTSAPLEVATEEGTCELSLNFGNGLVVDSAGILGVDSEVLKSEPIQEPLLRDENGLRLRFGIDTMAVANNVQLTVNDPKTNSPLFINSNREIELQYASHFRDDEGLLDGDGSILSKGLSLKINDPLFFSTLNSHKLSLAIDNDTLAVDRGELKAKIPPQRSYVLPLNEEDDIVSLQVGERLEIEDGKLTAVKQEAPDTLKGSGALSVYTDITEFSDGSLIKLSTDTNNFQQTNGKLAFRSTGLGQVPYDSGISGLNRSEAFVYNDTLSVLNVSSVKLASNLSPDSNHAVTAAYVQQLYQAGSGIDISPATNGRRLRSSTIHQLE